MDDIQGLQAEGLGKSYHGRPVVRDVSINLKRGEAVGCVREHAARRGWGQNLLIRSDNNRLPPPSQVDNGPVGTLNA